ncbi:MAG: CBASS cGAMP-activated phospholipase [Sphingopyxis sp.]
METYGQSPLRRSEGTLGERRRQLPWPEGRRFRILSIDGGGIRGILPASILAEFERQYLGGISAGDYFDLIAGTSTGGIIALGLSIGLPASEILDLYFDHGEEIFPVAKRPLASIKRLWAKARSLAYYQYDRQPLEGELRRIFGTRAFGEAQRRLCIPSFDGFTEVNIFKTPHHPDFRLDWREEMVTVALATSAAPTFFSIYEDGQRRFADGGVWANNPVMVALVDALSCNALERDQIDILSLGCGDAEITMSDSQVRRGGLWHWREIVSSAMHLSSQNALGQAGLLIGRDRLVRLNAPLLEGGPIGLDDVKRAKAELPTVAKELALKNGALVASRFFSDKAQSYASFHRLNA